MADLVGFLPKVYSYKKIMVKKKKKQRVQKSV